MKSSSSAFVLLLITASVVLSRVESLNIHPSLHATPRRYFLQKPAGVILGLIATSLPKEPSSATTGSRSSALETSTTITASTTTVTQTIKVTPVAHTFISSVSNDGKITIKPLRENDATRYFTNARVVHLFYNGENEKAIQTVKEILELTIARKAGQGPGVTPGRVHILSNNNEVEDVFSNIAGLSILKEPALKYALANLPSGDVVFLSPKKSNGTIINGMLVEQSALTCGLDVGGGKSGGVISCLMNGPRDPETIAVLDGGYTSSTILWYT